MLTLPVEEWIGNAAAVLSGVWGAVTQRSQQSGYSRTAMYQPTERVVQAVANEQAGGISYEDLRAENERLKAENEALWQTWAEVEELRESKQHKLVLLQFLFGAYG
jgi:cell shape-determining protein MreC